MDDSVATRTMLFPAQEAVKDRKLRKVSGVGLGNRNLALQMQLTILVVRLQPLGNSLDLILKSLRIVISLKKIG